MDVHFIYGVMCLALAFLLFGIVYDQNQENEIGVWEAFFDGGVVALLIVTCIIHFGKINF